MNDRTPTAPKHLSTPSQRWWLSVVAEYQLEEHHVRLLTLLAESWDRGQQARKMVDLEGLVTVDRFGQPREHPAVRIERDSRLTFAKLLRELALDVEAPDASRPVGITGKSHLKAG